MSGQARVDFDRHRPEQSDLFLPAPDDAGREVDHRHPLVGLRIILQGPCFHCGAAEVEIGTGTGPHLAAMICIGCGSHRGWSAHMIFDRLVEIVRHFGRWTSPVALRQRRTVGFIYVGRRDRDDIAT